MERDDFHRQAWILWHKLQDLSNWIWDTYELNFAEFIDKELEENAMAAQEDDDAWVAHLEQEGFFDQP